jgi:transposase InsO family protein
MAQWMRCWRCTRRWIAKALMPDSGCRAIALLFNRRHGRSRSMMVGKTFVSDTIRRHLYEIQVLRRKIKHARPKPVPHNLIWAMDLTGKTDGRGRQHRLLGILEHHSRGCLRLAAVRDKTTVTMLRHLLEAIERFGRPKIVRTDNEALFTSLLFRLALWALGIRHQRTEPGCPWQNGRIERFFGTLKAKLDRWEVGGREELGRALVQFRLWYNHVRIHQNPDGCTPAEVWSGRGVPAAQREHWFEAWDGLLTGLYFAPG